VLAVAAALSPARGADDAQPAAGQAGPAPASGTAAPSGGDRAAAGSPWAFGLGLYTWLPAVDADLTSGIFEAEIDESLFDIIDATKGVPLSIGGRIDVYWKRLGFFVDTNYFLLRFREQDISVGNVLSGSAEVTTQMSFLEYCALFRVFGPPAGERPRWAVESAPPRVDLYAGARTIWLKNEIEPQVLPDSSVDEVFTSPLVGARVEVDLGPRWFFRMDGNVGGFGVDDVEFVGEGLAAFGLRMAPLHLPTELWLGYQVLYVEAENGGVLDRLESDTLLHGPALGIAFSW
jgi:hypothetical protein